MNGEDQREKEGRRRSARQEIKMGVVEEEQSVEELNAEENA